MAEVKQKSSFKDKIKMDTQELCEAAIKNGWIAALISMGITLVFGIIGFFTRSDNETINYYLDPWLLVYVVLMLCAVLIFGIKNTKIKLKLFRLRWGFNGLFACVPVP